ncbi:Tetratricopeptide repeat-containing protein [Polaromonas sp. YR568]|uniref:VIT domain-containing protein n=1 Tax=Polaromonas sp. YR568 TaxID=1855301 RepID=UPI0008DEACBB|nr:VIT domain-containing protein [Polaromonas sp. YR568]SFU88840.1 Tetratricopeptide repeat-containing protein [Polaromonas sp. YR568]
MPHGSRVIRFVQAAAAVCFSFQALALSPMPQPISGGKFAPPPDWRPPVIALNNASGQPIALRAVSMEVDLFGDQAQTRVELRLFNPNHRVLEGELQFPLQEGQVVTGFALDVNGHLRDAAAVPKARGQEIFEDIRRRRVDPGLLEATAGNQYKLRVYPIPAQGERRVVITINETLPRLHNSRDAGVLRVPLAFASAVGQLQLRVHAHGAARQDLQLIQAPADTQLSVNATGTELYLQKNQWTAPQGPAGWLQLAVRRTGKPQIMVGESGGKPFFAGQIDFRDELVKRPAPSHIALVWDASASAASQARVLPVLDAYFRKLDKAVKVSLLVVRNKTEPVRSFTVAPGRFGDLASVLRAEPFDGSSNFDNLPIPADADMTLMVTDGLMTDGKKSINYLHTAPVMVINGAASADTARLARLADRTGGALVDATLLTAEAGAQAMLMQGWRIERLASLSAQKLVTPTTSVRQGRIAVAGELLDTQARIDIALVHPDGRKRTLTLDVNAKATAGRWPGQQWAQWRSAELAENAGLHSGELQRIAAEHGIVGPNSSLIVLELASDYANYKLPAPPELADEVARISQQLMAQATHTRQAHIEAMVKQFDTKQRWWDKDFPKDAPKRAEPKAEAEVQGGIGAMGASTRGRERFDAMRKDQAFVGGAPVAAPMPIAPSPAAAAPAAAAQAAPAALSARAADTENRQAKTASAAAPSPTIALQAWVPDAPYMKRLQDADKADLYRVYLDERAAYLNSSSFYMDAAGVFLDRGLPELGLRVLSNLAEMNLENRQLLRLYAYRLVQAQRADLAIPVFERISELAPNEPQSWRDLGLALADSGQPQRAVNALWEVVSRPWNGRFAGINMIALAELNAIATQAAATDVPPLDMSRVDTRLRRNLPLALRVVMAWDSDDTDIDMWVTDPNGEKASYANRLTRQGGAMSPDATGGYGPEEFSLKTAKAGKYTVEAQFFGHRQQVLSGGTTVMVRITTGFGTPQARDEWTTLRLAHGQETVRVAGIEVR